MKNALRVATLLTVMAGASGIANGGIILTNLNGSPVSAGKEACAEPSEKSLTGILIVNLTAILITNLTGIVVGNPPDGSAYNCGIIIKN